MPTQPNILVVMTDDHGPWALGAAGCRAAQTPTLDWLAGTGARFRHAFTPNPVCSPARASFFTGLIPSAHGIHDWIDEKNCLETDWLGSRPTLAGNLRSAGYATALIGKWHCGRSHVPQPGFDHWFSHAKGHQFPHFGPQAFATNDRGIVMKHGRQSQFLLDEARSWLRQRKSAQPFFLFYGPADTHSPFSGNAPWLVDAARRIGFADVTYEPGRYPPERRALAFPETEEARTALLEQYLASVASIDAQLGGLMETLQETGVLENTLVLYLSDHGHMDGHHGLVGKGNASIPQNFYDESIQVPCLARWPGVIPPGCVIDAPVDHCDWYRTLLDVGGAAAPAGKPASPGQNVSPLWQNPASAWRQEQVCEYGNARMIRTSTRKLIVRKTLPGLFFPDELYDLAEDPRETENRIDRPSYAAEIAGLRTRLEAYFQRWTLPEKSGWEVAALPQFNPAEAWSRTGFAPR